MGQHEYSRGAVHLVGFASKLGKYSAQIVNITYLQATGPGPEGPGPNHKSGSWAYESYSFGSEASSAELESGNWINMFELISSN